MLPKTLIPAFFISALIHGGLAMPMINRPSADRVSRPVEPIAISYVLSPKIQSSARSVTAKAKEKVPIKASPKASHKASAAAFLTDPQKGKIFVGYFGVVKEKIHETLRQKYPKTLTTSGTVSLSFVLRSDGQVESAEVMEKESNADTFLRDFAMRALKESGPFPKFPKSLGSEPLSFSVTIFFDEL